MREAFVFIFGLIFGSFFNVVLLRKNTGESVIFNGSRCFSCGKKLKFIDLIPVLSFLWRRGRCRYCGSRISWQYPIAEVGVGIMGVLIYSKFPISNLQSLTSFIFYFAAFSLFFLIAAYDFRNKIIDKHFLYGFGVFAIAEFLRRGPPAGGLADDLASSFFIALLFYFLWRFSSGVWMGRGDADSAFAAAIFLGFPQNVFMLFLSFWIGGFIGLVLLLDKKFSLKTEVPFGPFLAAALFLTWYFDNFLSVFYGIIF